MANSNLTAEKVAEQLAGLRNTYLARLPAELGALQVLAQGLVGAESDRASLDEIYHRLHKLTGSGGTFGLSELSKQSRALEHKAKVWLSGLLEDVAIQERNDFLFALEKLHETLTDVSFNAGLLVPAKAKQDHPQTLSIWLVENDFQLGKELSRQLESFNYAVRLFTKIADAESAAHNERPDMLLMDVMFKEEGENSTQVLNYCPNLKKLSCPLIFISSKDDFQSRLRAAKLGTSGYFIKPLDVPRLVGRMTEIFEQNHAPPQRVLIVDDDVPLAAHYRLALLGAGMEVEVLHQPELIIKTIAAFRPELILMDMHMPDYSGADIAGVIRQYDKLASLPVVYLSAEVDLDKQIEALNRGADDFLTKPISDAQLVAAVHVRIERARHLEGQITKDSLTGLLKHASIKDAIELEVLRARRSGLPVSVAMMDIDHFKRVNDTYGHAAGDVVISAVALLLRQRLRQSDIIGRYGGEEFAVLLHDCDVQNAKLLLEDVRQSFAKICFSHESKEFSCTLSGGLACSIQYSENSGAELLVVADEALYAAKHGGRNQIRVATVDITEVDKT